MLHRRAFLHQAAAFGLFSSRPVLTFAAAPTDKRLAVIVLRGGMDGLDVVQPVGDPAFSTLRPRTGMSGPAPAQPLDDFYHLHGGLQPLMPLYRSRELSFVHAVSTPYRQRSHFDAQDLLEEGGSSLRATGTGWVNRLIGLAGSHRMEFAADIGTGDSLLLKGPAAHLNLYPETGPDFWQNSSQFLQLLYESDPAFQEAFARIESAKTQSMDVEDFDKGVSVREIATLAAKILAGEGRIAAFSLYGWDTHFRQERRLNQALANLSSAIEALKAGLGTHWQDTAVVAVSEFGRTARFNGTLGTDHGTGGVAILAGGLLANGAGGKVLTTRWPGLDSGSLYEDRDLMPTDDVRRYLGWLAADLFNLDPGAVAREVFPGADLGQRLRLI